MKSFQFKRTQRKYKTRYKTGNWAAYEGGLRQRGSMTIWLSEDLRKAWCYHRRRKPTAHSPDRQTLVVIPPSSPNSPSQPD